jgi:hypothetical protein
VSPAPSGAHPSPEEVDALLDLSQTSDADERVAAHVAGCEQCTALLEGMRSVRELLRSEGERVPEPPADLDARLSSALALASAERSGTIVPLDAARERRQRDGERVPRWLVVAAGLAVLGGTGVAASQLFDDTGGADSATTLESGAAEGPEATLGGLTRASGTDYRPDQLAAQVDELLDVPSLMTAQGGAGDGQGREREGGDDAAVPDSDLDSGLDSPMARTLLDDSPLADPAGLAACLAELDAAGQVPLAVDLGTWQGEPAAVIVLPDPADADRVQAWVVSPECGADGDHLMHFQALPR